MSAEAGPSSAPPLFKKRGKGNTTRISASVIDEISPSSSGNASTSDAPTTTAANEGEGEEVSVQDLIALRSLTRKPTGIELDRLNKGERKRKAKKEKSSAQLEEERWEAQMKRGGLMSGTAGGAGEEDEESDTE